MKSKEDNKLVNVLANVHIPFLESTLNAKQKEIEQLSNILHRRVATIARQKTFSSMKNEELKQLRMENEQLKAKIHMLQQQL